MEWDEFTVKHLDAWIDRNVPILEQDETKEQMIQVSNENPWMVDIGWNRVYDEVKGFDK